MKYFSQRSICYAIPNCNRLISSQLLSKYVLLLNEAIGFEDTHVYVYMYIIYT
jgi:hypothetical protein